MTPELLEAIQHVLTLLDPRSKCFNCSGTHCVNNKPCVHCPMRHDQQQIEAAERLFALVPEARPRFETAGLYWLPITLPAEWRPTKEARV